MDDDFDEFGNFVGKEEYSQSGSESDEDWEDEVEIVENSHDEQSISEPLLKQRDQHSVDEIIVEAAPDWNFHFSLKSILPLNRYLTIVGLTNHGKTSLFNLLSPDAAIDLTKEPRQLTMTAKYTSVVQQNSHGKSFLVNVADTPGHEDFAVERMISQRASDGNLLIVDCIEGTRNSLTLSRTADLIVISKFDRLMFDLKLPAQDAFERLDYLITQELQTTWESVVFVSAKFKFAFTLDSINKLYMKYRPKFSTDEGGAKINLDRHQIADYVINPIFKLFSYGIIGESCQTQLSSLGIILTKEDWRREFDDRIALIMSLYFERPLQALIDAIFSRLPSPKADLLPQYFSCTHENLLFGRAGMDSIHIDSFTTSGRGLVRGSVVPPCSWFYTYSDNQADIDMASFEEDEAVKIMMIGVEPLQPTAESSEALGTQLRHLSHLFPGISIGNSGTGEFMVYGTGELYLDTALRHLEGAFRVSQPTPVLMETVAAETSVLFSTKSPDLSVTVSITAEPLDWTSWSSEKLKHDSSHLELWHEFPDNLCVLYGPIGQNSSIVEGVIRGIKGCLISGPLIESQIRLVKFNVTEMSKEPSFQFASTARRAAYAALLLASPRLLEPRVTVSTIGTLAAGKAVYSEISKRSGNVVTDLPIYGTNLYLTEAEIPLMDCMGLQLDILCQMEQRNDATVSKRFNQWAEVAGDPLDTTIVIKRMQPAESIARSRDFMLKIRRRKGLSDEPDLSRYVDERVLRLLSK